MKASNANNTFFILNSARDDYTSEDQSRQSQQCRLWCYSISEYVPRPKPTAYDIQCQLGNWESHRVESVCDNGI